MHVNLLGYDNVNSIHADLQLSYVMWFCGMSAIELPALCAG